MNRQWRWMIGVPALMSAALLFAAGTSAAKGPGGGGGGRGGGGGGHSGGGGSGRSMGGGGGPSRSMGAPSRSAPSFAGPSRLGPSVVSPAVAGRTGSSSWNGRGSWDGRHFDHDGFRHHSFFFFGYPFYNPWFWGYGYPYPYFYGNFPSWYYWSDYAYDRGPVYVYDPDNGSLSTQQDPPPVPSDLPKLDDNAVLIGVRVPENAEIWFDGEKTSQKGTLREFVTPPLDPGQKYTYEIKARWNVNGREMTRVRKQEVYAGDRLLVNMLAPEKKAAPPKP